MKEEEVILPTSGLNDRATQASDVSNHQIFPTRKQIMCKVKWMKVERNDTELNESGFNKIIEQPEDSKVSLSVLRKKDPMKLLEFYEKLYFSNGEKRRKD